VSRRSNGLGWYTGLIALSVVFVAPLLWMVVSSFKTRNEALRIPPTWWPLEPTNRAYDTILGADSQAPVFTWFLNSLFVASVHTVLVLVVASCAAYPLARLDFAGKRVIFGLIVSTLLVPTFALLIPNYLVVDRLGWIDTLWALIVPGAASAFGVFFLRQFFLSLPSDLEEAALLDGANHFQIFARVVLPLSKPALATLAVLTFLANWNEFIWPIFVIFSAENMTLPPGLATLQSAYVIDFPILMAGSFIASIPVLILFAFTQRYVIEGVSRSGLKG
jgi:multiple sugar transport system permease protein